jgi:hypothetical protein
MESILFHLKHIVSGVLVKMRSENLIALCKDIGPAGV